MESVQNSGDAGARVTTHTGMKIDLKVVEPDQFGNVLQHFTGSKAHNVALREAAVRRGLHVSEYGILDDETGETLRCATEEEVYERLGLPWIPPELREGRGELEAARERALPALIALEDLRGDLHMHTTASDGLQTAEEMARAARERGLEYIAITDHSASHGFGNDVSPAELERRIDEIHALDERLEGIEVLIGTESNILTDGSLDYPDELLERLDWVIASVHTSFRMRSKEMTDRMVAAIEHPLVDAIGHPTGRKIERRPPYALDTRPRDRGGRADGHDARDQRRPRPPRPRRDPRPRGRARGRSDPDRLRRALGGQPAAAGLRRRHRAPRLAHPGAGRQRPSVGGVPKAAQTGTFRSELIPEQEEPPCPTGRRTT